MPIRNFRNVEYYSMFKDKTWERTSMLIPEEIKYEDAIDYIKNELIGLQAFDNIEHIAISNFAQTITTTAW